MRNLKKILALVLALVMSLSLMAVASADEDLNLGDVSDVYAESVDVLTGLKVFMGNKGEFLPKDNITRAEVAAIIYRIVTGDVTNTQNSIYADYNKFSDVTSDAWYAGYVNYCANAEYIKGKGFDANGKAIFKPQDPVTGYEALAMILRAIGYDKNNEFTGSNWQIQTAATARNRGILENIAEGTLGTAAHREIVAEILCKTILVPVADYSLAFGYRTTDANGKDNETLAYRTFKMEKIDGVVAANEYADLAAETTLTAGKTRLETKNGPYTLDISSDLDVIGESRYVYVVPAAGSRSYELVCTGMYEAEGMNKVYESVNKEDISGSKFNTVTGMIRSEGETEDYLNFGPNTDWKSDWRIRYVVSMNATKRSDALATPPVEITDFRNDNDVRLINKAIAELHGKFNLPDYKAPTVATETTWNSDRTVATVAQGSNSYYVFTWDKKDDDSERKLQTITYSKEFGIDEDITPISLNHQENIYQIFNTADRNSIRHDKDGYIFSNDGFVIGEVYVGTTSLEDVSDKMSYEQFKTTYIKEDDMDPVNGNENGNWLKVIDNDNDNVADYVLKVVYTFAQVTAVDADGKATLDTKNVNFTGESTHVTAGLDTVNLLTSQSVVCADTLATGNIVYYAVIDGKAQTYIPEMVSGRPEKIDRTNLEVTTTEGTTYKQSGVHEHVQNPDIESGVLNLSGTYTYDMYLDRGGHLAAFTHNPTSEFVLMTNGWYNQQRGGVEYAAMVYNNETKMQVDTDVTSGGSLFIGNSTNWVIQNNNWNAMKSLGGNLSGALDNVGSLNHDSGSATTAAVRDVRTSIGFINGDGALVPVDRVYNNKTVRMIALDEDLIPNTNGAFYGTSYRTSLGANTAYDIDVANTATMTAAEKASEGVITGSATASHNNKVELRALSNTVYYYVYPGVDGKPVVNVYTGYTGHPTVSRDQVEDVYAVGTMTRRVSNLAENSIYYTANAVVVELNGTYNKGGEQIFIYDFPYVDTLGTRDTIKYIDSNGEFKEAVVDLNASQIRSYLSAYGKDVIVREGLYYMYPTTTEGVNYIEAMSNDDIAANGYVLGHTVTEDPIGWNNWVSLRTYTGGTAPANLSSGTSEYTLSSSSHVYELSYSNVTDANTRYQNYTATLNECAKDDNSLADFLGEQKIAPTSLQNVKYHNTALDHTPFDVGHCQICNATGYWNHNDLLIARSGSTIKYVISFANFDADRTSGVNYAQAVWNSQYPSSAGGTLPYDISFYGAKDDGPNDDSSTNPETSTERRGITVPYAAVNTEANEIVVKSDIRTIKTVKVISPAGLTAVADAWNETWTVSGLPTDPATLASGYTVVIDVVDTSNRNTTYTLAVKRVEATTLTQDGTNVSNGATISGIRSGEPTEVYLNRFVVGGDGKAEFTFVRKYDGKLVKVEITSDKTSIAKAVEELANNKINQGDEVANVTVRVYNAGSNAAHITAIDTAAQTIETLKEQVANIIKQKLLTELGMSNDADLESASDEVQAMVAAKLQSIKNAKSMSALATALGLAPNKEISIGTDSDAGKIMAKDEGTEGAATEAAINLDNIKTEDENGNTVPTVKPSVVKPDTTITFTNNVATLTRDVVLSDAVAISADSTVNLNGHTVTGAAGKNVFNITGGKLTVNGTAADGTKGKLIASNASAINVGAGSLDISGVTITGAAAADPTDAKSAIRLTADTPANAEIKVTNCVIENSDYGMNTWGTNSNEIHITVTGSRFDTKYPGLYFGGNSVSTVENCVITSSAESGVEVRAGKSVTLKDCTVTSTASAYSVTESGNGTTTIGAGLAVAQHIKNQPVNVTVIGGTYKGVNPISVANPNDSKVVATVTVQGATLLNSVGGTVTTILNTAGDMAIVTLTGGAPAETPAE